MVQPGRIQTAIKQRGHDYTQPHQTNHNSIGNQKPTGKSGPFVSIPPGGIATLHQLLHLKVKCKETASYQHHVNKEKLIIHAHGQVKKVCHHKISR
jgi:hypothetical protein